MPTPPDPEPPRPEPPRPEPPQHDGDLEPVRVLRLRHFDALADLMRELRPEPVTYEPVPYEPVTYSPVPYEPVTDGPGGVQPAPPSAPDRTPPAPDRTPEAEEEDTQELPTVPPVSRAPSPRVPSPRVPSPRVPSPRAPASRVPLPPAPSAGPPTAPVTGTLAPMTGAVGPAPRRAALAVAAAVLVAGLAGFGCAQLLGGRQQTTGTAHHADPTATAPRTADPATPAPAAPAPGTPAGTPAVTATAPPADAADPDGPGTLRRGDTGPEVTDLQERLLGVPDVYRDGSTSGTYDATLTEAVARFQLWYGISGDETGVYGDDTRHALESRTGPDDDS
ncbi:peptidoglycan-binding protein [Streptomyces sp. NPDC048514]|uniref:peptidoglycan-binding domain-containing protein n=1 Tax=Streptomyces sp. NPDC048514 TaxID=3365564 RepID=UPI00371F98B5